jgi:hypothetical protein
MRKTIQRLLWVVLGLGFIALQAWSLVSANLTSSEQTLIDGFIERRADSYSQNEASSKAISIQERIAYTLQVITPNDFTLDILQYIDVVLNQYILTTPILIITPSTPVVTVPSIPVPLAQDSSLLTLIENFDESREVVVLAWEQQQVVAEFELNARLEPFVLEDITIGSSVSDIQNTIAQLHLYDENGSKLWSDRADSSWNFDFKNLGYTLEQWTTKVYAVIDTMIVWYNGNGQNDLVALTLQVTDGEARGEFSSTKYSINQSNTSKTITIQSVLIKSVDFISEAEWVRVDTQLTNGNNTLAILEIQTADSSNQEVDSSRDLDVLLDTLQIQISDNTVGDSATNSLVLERLDTNWKRIVWTVVGDQVIFTFDDDDTAWLIQNWESAYYRIVAENVQLSPSQWESVSIEISNAREAVIYHSSDPSSSLFGKNWNKNFFIQNSSLSD